MMHHIKEKKKNRFLYIILNRVNKQNTSYVSCRQMETEIVIITRHKGEWKRRQYKFYPSYIRVEINITCTSY